MNRQDLTSLWDHFREIQGVTLRTIERVPSPRVDARPVPGMRSVRELVDHMYLYVRSVPDAILRGELRQEDCPSFAERLATTKDMVEYANESFRTGNRAIAQIEDSHLRDRIPTFFGSDMSGSRLIRIIYDEHLHHRGQFYAYLRALGIEPPFLWSFDDNAPEYQPRAMRA